ncbi:MAG: glycosyltransferase [Thermodesulfovibrionales bacterium]
MKILYYTIAKVSAKFFTPFIEALSNDGHTVVIARNPSAAALREHAPDLIVTTSSDVRHADLANRPWLLDETGIPYMTVWFQTPLRSLPLLRGMSSLHRGMLLPDSTDTATLRSLGFDRSFYFPISWWVDTACFRPLPPEARLQHEVAWDCTFQPLSLVLHKIEEQYRGSGLSAVFQQAKRELEENLGRYLCPFEMLRRIPELDIWSRDFQELYNTIFTLQKAIDRHYVIRTLRTRAIRLTIYGGFSIDHNRVNYNHTIVPPPGVTIHDYIDTFTELPKLYASSTILLSRMMYPSGVHDRLFCAAATKGFVLSEWKDDAARAFEPGKEIIMYRDTGELPDLIRYYLAHDGERRKIAEAAHRRFLAEHTPLHRAREFIAIAQGLL